ncbi:MAG: nucleoside hydrolase [Flavobacterium sp.]|nr:nucleoside hydrolase [Pedobacter sp.]
MKLFYNSLFLLLLFSNNSFSQKQKVWLDADTGNEMDDLYAIVRLVKEQSIDLVGLSSAHFNNADLLVFEKWNGYEAKGLNTVAESQRLNEVILKALNCFNVPHPLGADRQIGRAWGQQDARPSPASKSMIALANSLPEGELLHIITLGALTNVASALIESPGILNKIKVYSLGAKYNPKTKVWDKSEFNIRNDLNAFDYLLNLRNLDFTIMPLDAAFPLQFKREDTYNRLDESKEIEKILEDRWREHNPQDENRIMWDLALVEAYIKPGLCQLKKVRTPPENTQRNIKVFTKINEKALAEDFWKNLEN